MWPCYFYNYISVLFPRCPVTNTKLRQGPVESADPLLHFIDLHLRLNNMSRRELAQRAGYPLNTLTDWWRGQYAPKVTQLRVCMKVIGYDIKPTPVEQPAIKRKGTAQ